MSALSLLNGSALTLSLSQVKRTSCTLGADFLDRVELMLAIEDQFAGVEITDDDVEQIQVVGDLVRHVQNTSDTRRNHASSLKDSVAQRSSIVSVRDVRRAISEH